VFQVDMAGVVNLVLGQIDVFDEITIFIALTDTPILNWLFKKFEYPQALHFAIDNDFSFHLLSRDDADMDLFHYHVSYEETTLRVSVMGIDTTEHCGPYSNIDLVYFMWEHYIRFTYKNLQLPSHLAVPRQSPN